MSNTKFADPTGLDSDNISTAFDLSKLLFHAIANSDIKNATTKKAYNISILNNKSSRTVYNTDILLDSFINKEYTIIGGKTGYTPDAGACLAIRVEDHEGNDIIVVVMGSRDQNSRFHEVKALTQWTFDNYTWE